MVALFLVFRREVEPFRRVEHRPGASRVGHFLFPGRHAFREIRGVVHRLVFERAHFRENFVALFLLISRRHFDERLVVVVQEREELVILALRNRVELVIVALTAVDGQAEPRFADGVHPVNHGFGAELFRLDAAFLIQHGVSQKTGGNALVECWVWQQIAGELFEGEFIEWQVAIERLDDPVAIRPDRTRGVLFVTVRVRVARGIQPLPPPTLAIVGRSEQSFDEVIVSVRRFVADEFIHFRRRGRQTDQIEAQAAAERYAVSFRHWLQAFFVQTGEHEIVDGISDPPGAFDFWHTRADGRFEAPMLAFVFDLDRRAFRPIRSLVDPRAQQTDLFHCQAFALLRHKVVLAFETGDQMNHHALSAFALDDYRPALTPFEGDFLGVPAQHRLLLFFAVALITTLRQDGLNVFDEINFSVCGWRQL